jgi:hypothetical protein
MPTNPTSLHFDHPILLILFEFSNDLGRASRLAIVSGCGSSPLQAVLPGNRHHLAKTKTSSSLIAACQR